MKTTITVNFHKKLFFVSPLLQFLLYFLENLCDVIDDLCSQICVNTDKSYYCKCREGFELLEDKITCIPKERAELNEIPTNDTLE